MIFDVDTDWRHHLSSDVKLPIETVAIVRTQGMNNAVVRPGSAYE